jgi:hypothetical protein
MKRILGRVVVVCASALVIGAVAPACVENDQSLFVRAVLAPSTNRQNGVCSWTDDPQQTALFEGFLDVGARDNYVAVVLVGNQLRDRGDPAATRAEPNRVHLNGAVVRVLEPNGAQIAEFTSLATGFADVGQNNNPDFGLMGVVAIDAPTAAGFRTQLSQADGRPNRTATRQIVVQLKAFGKTLGGVDLESSEFQFPMRICNGCLVSFAGANDPAQTPNPNCLAAIGGGASGGGSSSLPCHPGQDEPTPCQLCQGRDACDPAKL